MAKEGKYPFFKRFKGFSEWFNWPDGLGIRLGIGLLFTFILAIFLHLKEIEVASLELGTHAKNYVVAQVAFEFADEEKQLIKQQQAVRDVESIYEMDKADIDSVRLEIEKEVVSSDSIDRASSDKIFELLDALTQALLQTRFTHSKTIDQMKKAQMLTTYYEPFYPRSDMAERLPSTIFRSVEARAFVNIKGDPKILERVVNPFKEKKWNFKRDIQAEKNVRDALFESVAKVYTKVEPGERIVDQGQLVMPRHITKLQAMKKKMLQERKFFHPTTFLGSFLLAFLFVFITCVYLKMKQPHFLQSAKKLALFSSIGVIALLFSKVIEKVLVEHTTHLIDIVQYPLFVPFATILIAVLINTELALFSTAVLAVIFTITLAVDDAKFLTINLVASLVCLYSARHLRKRTEIFKMVMKGWFACLLVIFSFQLMDGSIWSSSVTQDIISTFIFMLFTAILCIGLLPPLESVFQLMTNITLMEYLDPNNPLLRRLSIEAPGTYQHSLVLANLTESAAIAIGANSVFCRVATMFHDIGKVYNPQYFTENQQAGFNMHQLLTPEESAQVIIEHVTKGELLARQYKLPQSFINVIREHHGTTLVYYFYKEELKRQGEDPSKVDEAKFRYPGPKPRTKESAIIMIADTVEAASRALETFTEEEMNQFVNRLVHQKAEDGQFDHCDLTFEELGQIKRTLIKNMIVLAHRRIKFPKFEEKKKEL
jgi:hypothetical protein